MKRPHLGRRDVEEIDARRFVLQFHVVQFPNPMHDDLVAMPQQILLTTF